MYTYDMTRTYKPVYRSVNMRSNKHNIQTKYRTRLLGCRIIMRRKKRLKFHCYGKIVLEYEFTLTNTKPSILCIFKQEKM